MKPDLKSEKLLRLLDEIIRENKPCAPELLEEAYEKFCSKIARLTDGGCSAAVIRALTYAKAEVETLQQQVNSASACGPLARLYCHKALEAIKCEEIIIRVSLEHPGALYRSEKVVSPLYIHERFSKTDLVEIIAPLYAIGFFTTKTGHSAKSKTVVRVFEKAFNVQLPNYDVLRNKLLNRKIHPTGFLDRLREILDEMSKQ